MNYMKDIAKLLGVELGEEFYLEDITDGCYLTDGNAKLVFKLSDTGLLRKDKHIVSGWIDSTCYLKGVFTGRYTIVKKPWKPKNGDKYYYVLPIKEIYQTYFYKDGNDIMRYVLGNCFQTEEEITPQILEETWEKCYGAYFQDDKQDGAQQ